MKTYREYYQTARQHALNWKYRSKTDWWRKGKGIARFEGAYLETVQFLSEPERNNMPIINNLTNVSNEDWIVLFHMLAQALIDWCYDSNTTGLDYYNITVKHEPGCEDQLEYVYKISYADQDINVDQSDIDKFDGCSGMLTDIVHRFFSEHFKDIPLDWSEFYFSFDNLATSCLYGEWVPYSDGCMQLSVGVVNVMYSC